MKTKILINSAIIGDSPIMLILAEHLKKKENITIFTNKDRVGGAWSYMKYKGENISRQTNVVVPVNAKVEKFQGNINNSLLRYNVKIEKSQGFHKPDFHLAKENFRYDFNELFATRDNYKVIKKTVKSICAYDQFVMLGNMKFDKIYIPYFNGIEKITIDNNSYDISPKVITSKHILLIFKNLPIEEFVYTESFDDMFDRAQITRFKNFVSMTARVRLENKKRHFNTLLKNSRVNQFVHSKNLLYSNILKYKNNFRNFEDIEKLKTICSHNRINVIDTFQFFEAFLELNKHYLNHF